VSEDLDRAIRAAAAVLKEEGAREVYLFGSLAKGRERPGSDIDLAVSGLPPERFFPALGRAHEAAGIEVDLIDLDEDTIFVRFIRERGGLRLVA